MENITAHLSRIQQRAQLAASRPSTQSETYACEHCQDSGWRLIEGKGAVRCACLQKQISARAFGRIPPLYRGLSLSTITPRLDLHAKQEALIAALKARPQNSYLIFGKNGCGKSLAGWLLYQQAIEDGRMAIGVSCAELLRQMRQWEMNPDQLPLITPEDLRTDKRRYLLFVDELDKARPSEYAGEMMYLLFEAAYSFGHQIVVTANMTAADLSAHWSRENGTYGPSILRRLMEIENCTSVEMF